MKQVWNDNNDDDVNNDSNKDNDNNNNDDNNNDVNNNNDDNDKDCDDSLSQTKVLRIKCSHNSRRNDRRFKDNSDYASKEAAKSFYQTFLISRHYFVHCGRQSNALMIKLGCEKRDMQTTAQTNKQTNKQGHLVLNGVIQ